jgi:hypothetical protein
MLFAPHHNTLSHTFKFTYMTTKMFLSFWIPMLRSTRSTTFLKISSKAPLKKLRNLTLRLRWELLHFWSWPFTDVDIKVFQDTFETAATWQGIMRILLYIEEILKENKILLSLQTSVLHFFKASWGAQASSTLLLYTGNDDPDYLSRVQEEVIPL